MHKVKVTIDIQMYWVIDKYPIACKWKQNKILSFSILCNSDTLFSEVREKQNKILEFCKSFDLSTRDPYINSIFIDDKKLDYCLV